MPLTSHHNVPSCSSSSAPLECYKFLVELITFINFNNLLNIFIFYSYVFNSVKLYTFLIYLVTRHHPCTYRVPTLTAASLPPLPPPRTRINWKPIFAYLSWYLSSKAFEAMRGGVSTTLRSIHVQGCLLVVVYQACSGDPCSVIKRQMLSQSFFTEVVVSITIFY